MAVARSEVKGKVETVAGKPIEGATVSVRLAESESIVVSTEADKKGKFRLQIEDPGTYVVLFESAGFGPHEQQVTLEGNESFEAEIKLLDEATWRQNRSRELYNQGVGFLQEMREQSALRSFEEAAELNPELAEPLAGMASIYHKLKRWDEAASAMDKLFALRPGDPQFASLQPLAFEAYYLSGKTDKARATLSSLAPADRQGLAPVPYNYGVSLNREEKFDQAYEAFDLAAEMDPELAAAHQGMAAIEFNRQNYEAALPPLRRLLEIDDTSVQGRRMLFYSLEATNGEGLEEARRSYLEVAPESTADEMVAAAAMQFEKGQSAEAESVLRSILQIEPDHPRAHYRLGLVLASKGEGQAAAQHLQRFVELAPDDLEAASAKAMVAELGTSG